MYGGKYLILDIKLPNEMDSPYFSYWEDVKDLCCRNQNNTVSWWKKFLFAYSPIHKNLARITVLSRCRRVIPTFQKRKSYYLSVWAFYQRLSERSWVPFITFSSHPLFQSLIHSSVWILVCSPRIDGETPIESVGNIISCSLGEWIKTTRTESTFQYGLVMNYY